MSQAASVPKPPVQGSQGLHHLGATHQGAEGGEVFSPQQILAAGWGYARLGMPGCPRSVASTAKPHRLRLAPMDPSVHPLGCSSPSSAFQFGLCLPKALFFLPCHGTALPEGKSSPQDTAWRRLAEGFSCGPGTMGSNNSASLSPRRILLILGYWPPKHSALSASPASPANEPPAMLQPLHQLPPPSFHTEKVSKELSR